MPGVVTGIRNIVGLFRDRALTVTIHSLSARFADQGLERLYRLEQVRAEAQQAFLVMVAVAVAMLLYAFNDWRLFGTADSFWYLVTVRVLFVSLSISIGLAVQRVNDPRRLDRLLLYWTLVFIIADLFIVSTRAQDLHGHAMVHGVLVLLIYVAMPLPLHLQTLIGLLFSFVYLYLVLAADLVSQPSARLSLIMTLVAANLLGYFGARRQHLSARRLFALLAHAASSGAEADRRSVTDPLTGLLNRAGWDERLVAIEDQSRASGRPSAIIAIDLDGLKEINDTQGHAQGDALLVRTAQCLREAIRTGDAVARLGGDEFAILAASCDPHCADALSLRVERKLRAAEIGASTGWAVCEPEGGLAKAWDNADRAMYRQKAAKRRDTSSPRRQRA